ncbi:MAG: hypothetical protein AAGD14_03845 [Planctomycetota bacterium]
MKMVRVFAIGLLFLAAVGCQSTRAKPSASELRYERAQPSSTAVEVIPVVSPEGYGLVLSWGW